ncbi:folylpolyglutamate synthase (plasmid) [Legionella adelaidensis]|uniref:Dihydrofolate synthase/folylpolyglutamate synthase n=1 Tax=Legionella adelaidensis TaxID=45056 RepID=A0A0W0R4D4_9GAMM|nr:bifunctional tetrahydrofolate synthase/dihydrofolate synthase [Legionella adelaidensis]KTC65870.1 bifunctional protein FolC [Legionella adelaidensis]VEH86187.1 folylpolyglutamate synthase [Legionella adelaidensis]
MPNFNQFTLVEWLNYLENRHPEEIRLGLSRVGEFARALNLIDWPIPVITVAGTNGKGSTVASLEAIYRSAGYRVGSYTSPHLIQFNERIRVNGNPIADEDLCFAFREIQKADCNEKLTYFEMATLAALWHFKQAKLDILVLEVGMGGRKDATNIIDADVAIITTIDFDHQEYLGATKEEIGYEKAGILKKNKILVYADEDPPQSVLQYAKEKNVRIYRLGEAYFFKKNDQFYIDCSFTEGGLLKPLPLPQVNLKAAAAAVVASLLLKARIPIEFFDYQKAMQSVIISGRQQLLTKPKPTIFDVAHNPQSVKLLAEFLKNFPIKGKIYAVFSALKDKDMYGLIDPLYNLVNFWYPAVLTGKRASDKNTLLEVFAQFNIFPQCFENPKLAYDHACLQATEHDLIVVYGSFLTVGSVMQALEGESEVV